MRKVEAFKNQLRNYSYYVKRKDMLIEEVNTLRYNLAGLKGVRYDKQMSNGSPNEALIEENRLDMIDRINIKEKEISIISNLLDMINGHLEELSPDIKKACIEMYINGKTYESEAKELFYSKTGLFKAINRELEDIL